MTYDEGVIKFQARHRKRELTKRQFGETASVLVAWRAILLQTGLVGQDPGRYGGAGYGNVSARVGAPSTPKGSRSFLISGTQTGGLKCVSLDEFAYVSTYNIAKNTVESEGLLQPSSEAMTHGAIYDLGSQIRFVYHGHCPVIWQQSKKLGIPQTDPHVPYGTPAMAQEVARLYGSSTLPERKVLSMGGHEDGIIVFGKTPDEAGSTMMKLLAEAYRNITSTTDGILCITD